MMRQVARLARTGDVEGCMALLRGPDVGTAEFNVALRWLPHAAAAPVFELMLARGVVPDKSTALSLLHFLRADRRKLDAALASMVEMHNNDEGSPDDCPVPFLLWASVHADAGDVEGVLRVMELAQVQGELLADRYVTQLIKAYGYSNRVGEARVLIKQVLDSGLPPDDAVIRTALNCLGRNGAASLLRELLEGLDAANVTPTAETFGAAIDACVEVHDAAGAARLFSLMRSDPRGPELRCVHAYTSMAKLYAARGDAGAVRRVLDLCRADGFDPGLHGWNSAIQANRVAGDPAGALEAVSDMRAAGVEPNSVTYETVLGAYASKGDTAGALAYAETLAGTPIAADLYFQTTTLRILADAGMMQEALALLGRMKRRGGAGPDRVTYMVAIDGALSLWRTDRTAHAEMLDKALELFGELSNLRPRRRAVPPRAGEPLLLDLHTHSPWTAQLATLSTLRSLIERGTVCDLKIITGRGRRSPYAMQGRDAAPIKAGPVLRDSVSRCLGRLMRVQRFEDNPGVLLVDSTELARVATLKNAPDLIYSRAACEQLLVGPRRNHSLVE